jgi:hypothetical protein
LTRSGRLRSPVCHSSWLSTSNKPWHYCYGHLWRATFKDCYRCYIRCCHLLYMCIIFVA